ncbi:helix-turn-helix domain-containing protein [Breoghania sp. L-A4]|uniref:ArsR/SmtB family transcription factor n=1 Tax=Breoghania sp. L-A4 TaxID=2304600 RepID=UPI0020BFFC84|nr:helix-turn-helix domain-containing protein [Breoghania sp. L-A4]
MLEAREPEAGGFAPPAALFAALGDETRLALLNRLAEGPAQSITALASEPGHARLTRQAVTKHLKILERAGVVHSSRSGRETLFEYQPGRLEEARRYLARISAQWDDALTRLQRFVED